MEEFWSSETRCFWCEKGRQRWLLLGCCIIPGKAVTACASLGSSIGPLERPVKSYLPSRTFHLRRSLGCDPYPVPGAPPSPSPALAYPEGKSQDTPPGDPRIEQSEVPYQSWSHQDEQSSTPYPIDPQSTLIAPSPSEPLCWESHNSQNIKPGLTLGSGDSKTHSQAIAPKLVYLSICFEGWLRVTKYDQRTASCMVKEINSGSCYHILWGLNHLLLE